LIAIFLIFYVWIDVLLTGFFNKSISVRDEFKSVYF
jgi:hypothetical protein